MTVRHKKQDSERGLLVGLVESIRKLSTAPPATGRFLTLPQAARRLRISMKELRLRIDSGELDTEKMDRREWVFLTY